MTASAHRKLRLIVAAATGDCAAAALAPADNVSTRVSWREVDPYEYAQPGTFVVTGTVEGTSLQARATVAVKEEM